MDKNKTINVDVQTASRILGISQDAVRKRIARGTIQAVQDKKGVWTVTLEDVEQDNRPESDQTSIDVVGMLEKHITFLERELERKDTIIMTLTQKIPLLEAPKEKYTLWERFFGKRGD
jgi:hypothetical protein